MKTKVLVVDDSSDFREIYSDAINEAGFKVETAENGKIAIEKMLHEPPQVILMDVNMPVLSGEETLAEMRKHRKLDNIPVIVMTVVPADEKGQQVVEAGPIVSYFTKDASSAQDVIEKIKEVLGTSEKRFEP
jgi:CheY-like chemotaxis protein